MPDNLNPVGWFEIPVADMDRAKAFYEAVFKVELQLNEMGPALMAWFPMYEDALGAAGTLIKLDGHNPSQDGVRVYFTAPDLEATLQRAADNGGEVLMPVTSIGEYGFVAHFVDTEGNRIAIHSRH